MKRVVKVLFFAFIVKPIVFVVLGLNIKGREKLPLEGGAVIAPNHNSHLDTLVIMSLYPLSKIDKIRPVAAADYFMRNKFVSWISTYCIGIIPLDRTGASSQEELFKEPHEALDNKDILILFPEGSRGKPEQMTRLKKGLFYLLKDKKDIPIIPIAMQGLGNSLPKGEALFVPFNCQVVIGESIDIPENSQTLNETLKDFFETNLKQIS
ncbi:lysophospholipid acyltransferase family protein [Aliarcobacter butzleri]|uniref:1-acyl-sn-glycerol-3-phosphate acyltransferase n=1 Tax=Aliarcobacter butzleri (strain RM4018) TaxID=367737 RepID=A8ER95_ALIB4|nr:lysophospholipid acyltransferase family protein [Aliarcobacter butzleri]ABV66469.1 1-acyl-sn-glycerol-3-phosphate acyltransferase [Aliarcobacter butzleri RM4018]MDN5048921.1 lysophospholipid acyltransferase family protein [Aliarcobacter butzleri]MDN5054830.1 lysophospholipid acyltransferase family protein [Aliarcobacter butzleri]MDN5056089.1 lysophospholipid acyltransferase family protein [Aliarcobacter butzleri]SNV23451.1 2-acyl-glycerophospho-ethanolamine acyltransferase [Aliarcobacter bu